MTQTTEPPLSAPLAGVVPEYGYVSAAPQHTFRHLVGPVAALLPRLGPGVRVLDIGCGNGAWAGWLLERGCAVVGVDASAEGIEQARRTYPSPQARFECAEIRPDLLAHLCEEPFDVVLSTEVVEHLYAPREWATCAFNALRPGGRLICSTPCHGYLKNLLSLFGKWDAHLSPLWDGGHSKFWSRRSLGRLLTEADFVDLRFRGAGRLPCIWMSIVMSGEKPVAGADT